jgi:NitT/TauT family transport system ATP-binding protein
MLFQNDGLFPWLTVRENVAFPLRVREVPEPQLRQRVGELCASVAVDGSLLDRLPRELSGGQRRRAELAAALAKESRLVLLDEPTSGFDFRLKVEIQELLYSVWRKEGAAFVTVTHDIDEAVYLGDRVLCLRDGRIVGEDAVPLPHPREALVRRTAEFAACVEDIKKRFSGA